MDKKQTDFHISNDKLSSTKDARTFHSHYLNHPKKISKIMSQIGQKQFKEGITLNELYGAKFKAVSCDQNLIHVSEFDRNQSIEEQPLDEELESDSDQTIIHQQSQFNTKSKIVSLPILKQNDENLPSTEQQEDNHTYHISLTKQQSISPRITNNQHKNNSHHQIQIQKKKLNQIQQFHLTNELFYKNKHQSPLNYRSPKEKELLSKMNSVKIVNFNNSNLNKYDDPLAIENHIAFRRTNINYFKQKTINNLQNENIRQKELETNHSFSSLKQNLRQINVGMSFEKRYPSNLKELSRNSQNQALFSKSIFSLVKTEF